MAEIEAKNRNTIQIIKETSSAGGSRALTPYADSRGSLVEACSSHAIFRGETSFSSAGGGRYNIPYMWLQWGTAASGGTVTLSSYSPYFNKNVTEYIQNYASATPVIYVFINAIDGYLAYVSDVTNEKSSGTFGFKINSSFVSYATVHYLAVVMFDVTYYFK